MASFNKVIVMGNVTRDIELRYTPKGMAVADISLAVNRSRTGDNGERIEDVTFIDITLWGRTAEIAHQYSGKGKPLHVEGRLQMDTWDDKETGKKRSKLKVVGENIQLLGSKSDSPASSPAPQGNQHKAHGNPLPQKQGLTPAQAAEMASIEGDIEDIPF